MALLVVERAAAAELRCATAAAPLLARGIPPAATTPPVEDGWCGGGAAPSRMTTTFEGDVGTGATALLLDVALGGWPPTCGGAAPAAVTRMTFAPPGPRLAAFGVLAAEVVVGRPPEPLGVGGAATTIGGPRPAASGGTTKDREGCAFAPKLVDIKE